MSLRVNLTINHSSFMEFFGTRPLSDSMMSYFTDAYIVSMSSIHDNVIKWKSFPRYRPFVRGIHRSPVNSPHKGQWRGALMFSLIFVWINGWVNNREAGAMRRYRAHYVVIVMHCGLVTPNIVVDLGHHWFRQWPVAWWHQAITWINVD